MSEIQLDHIAIADGVLTFRVSSLGRACVALPEMPPAAVGTIFRRSAR